MDKKLDDEKIKRVVDDGAKDINEEKVGETVAREAELNAKIALVPGWFDKQVKKFKLLFALLKDWWDEVH